MRLLINPEKESARERVSNLLANATLHPKTAVPNIERALDILEDHVDEVSSPLGVSIIWKDQSFDKIYDSDWRMQVKFKIGFQVLSVLPDSVPLCRLKKILENILESQFALARRVQIVQGLSQAEHEQVIIFYYNNTFEGSFGVLNSFTFNTSFHMRDITLIDLAGGCGRRKVLPGPRFESGRQNEVVYKSIKFWHCLSFSHHPKWFHEAFYDLKIT